MEDSKEVRQVKRKDWPVEKPKKLPAAFPEKFDIEQIDNSGDKKRGKGARFHGLM